MANKESGMSLVELLATLTLVSLVVILIWTTFSISTKHNIAETKKLRLQQEANFIATEIQRLHRHCIEYDFIVNGEQVILENCQLANKNVENYVISSGYYYSIGEPLSYPPNTSIEDNFNTEIEDLEVGDFRVIDKQNTKYQVSIPLAISRYKQN